MPTFMFGIKEKQYASNPAMVYVNQESLPQEMYHRLCSNPTQAVVLYDKQKGSNINTSIYDGYDLRTYGITTMFDSNPSLSQCQTIWDKELSILTQESVNNSSVIIIESNTNSSQQSVKHSLAKLLPLNYRQELQNKLNNFQAELTKINLNNLAVQQQQEEEEEEVKSDDHLTPDTDTEDDDDDTNDNENDTNDDNDDEDDDSGHALLVFSGFEYHSIESMRQFIQMGQWIETQCLTFATTKYTFLNKRDAAILILFENESDCELIIKHLNGIRTPNEYSNEKNKLIVKYANHKLTNRVKSLFQEIDRKTLKFEKQQQKKRDERRNNRNGTNIVDNNSPSHQIQQIDKIETNDNHNNNACDNEPAIKHIETNNKPRIKHVIMRRETNNNHNIDNEPEIKVIKQIKTDNNNNDEINAFVFGKKEEDEEEKEENDKSSKINAFAVSMIKSSKKNNTFAVSMRLKKGILKIINIEDDDLDEMTFNIDKNKILSYFGEASLGKYIREMVVLSSINVWQFKDNKKCQWIDVDMMLCLYLNILPLNTNIVIKTSKSNLKMILIRTSASNVVLWRGRNKIKLNQIKKSISNGIYLPSFWERELLNKSLNKTYLFTIDLDVFEYFGNTKYSIWYNYLDGYIKNKQIGNICSIQNWINYHSFNFYSNWKYATKHGFKIVKLWFAENKKQNVLKNGFYKSKNDQNGWVFYSKLGRAIKANSKSNVFLLCEVCIDEENEKELLKDGGGGYGACVLNSSLCAYPELSIRIKK